MAVIRPLQTLKTASGHAYQLARWHNSRTAPVEATSANIIVYLPDGFRAGFKHTGERAHAMAAIAKSYLSQGHIAVAKGSILFVEPTPKDFWLNPVTGKIATHDTIRRVPNLAVYPNAIAY